MKQPGDAVNMSQFTFVEIPRPITLSRGRGYIFYSAGDGGSRSIYILETPWDARHWRLRPREMHLLNLISFFALLRKQNQTVSHSALCSALTTELCQFSPSLSN
jgi:hypothetical protein